MNLCVCVREGGNEGGREREKSVSEECIELIELICHRIPLGFNDYRISIYITMTI